MRSRIDAQFLHARDQRGALDPHACCGTVGASYSPVRDCQDADDLIAVIGFARAHHRNGPAVVAQLSDRGMQCRTVSKDHRTLDEILQLANIPPREYRRNTTEAS